MNTSLIFAKAHGGIAMLLFLLALISLALAIKTLASGGNQSLNKMAHIAGLVETIMAGLLTLSGIACLFVTPWPLSQIWIWLGLVLVVLYSIFMKRLTKPARLAAAEGEPALKWLGFQSLHLVLLIAGFGLMQAKPF
ncbi:MAG: hypothetical protein HRU20_00470 [Pseudomonadales bacterium]|nr:hypothetical protein [Pseudomonadales bacterium]